jgi:predicted nucleotidyltransferase
MSSPLSDSDILSVVREVLPPMQAAYLFGSRAGGAPRPDSDLDLAVLLRDKPDPMALWEAGEAIAARLNVDVDLVDLRAASTVLQFQVVTTGRLLCGDRPEVERFEVFVLREMADLNMARAPLLADIAREGRIHDR